MPINVTREPVSVPEAVNRWPEMPMSGAIPYSYATKNSFCAALYATEAVPDTVLSMVNELPSALPDSESRCPMSGPIAAGSD